MAAIAPADEAGIIEAVRAARAAGTALEIEGGGSKQGFGRPVQAASTLSLARHRGVTLYRPGELVIRALAGTPTAEVERALDEAGQMLPFEPPDLARLLGNGEAVSTIGGLVATNLSGPARIARGALRDSLIGVRFVDGAGEVVRSGGRVMKNVTGLDLVKLQAGAHGTMGVLTEVTFKVLPKAEATRTLVLRGLGADAAGAAMRAAMATPFEVTAAAWLPAAVAGRSCVDAIAAAGTDVTLLRLEHFRSFLDRRAEALVDALDQPSQALVLDDEASRALWAEVRDVDLLAAPADRAIWRLSTTPSEGPALLDRLAGELDAVGFLDWSGGLLWLAVEATADAAAARIRALRGEAGGHATLVRAPAAVRAAADVFEPEAAPLIALNQRLKNGIDPNRVLNPGRMYAGV